MTGEDMRTVLATSPVMPRRVGLLRLAARP